jgi:hypothetical protein
VKRRSAPSLLLLFSAAACLRAQETPEFWSCHEQSDCLRDEVCQAGQCRPQGYCETAADCSATSVCESSRCVVVECTPSRNEACAPFACRETRCLTSCTLHMDCASPGSHCIDHDCVPPECLGPEDCDGYVCRSGRCTTSCRQSSDCAIGRACIDQRCQVAPEKAAGASCTQDAECASHECCSLPNAVSGHCINGCFTSPDGAPCQMGEECLSGSCSNSRCTSCAAPPCAPTECANAQCGYVNGFPCGTCPIGSICNSSNQCVEQICNPGAETFCEGNAFYRCDYGTNKVLLNSCGESAYCDENSKLCEPYGCEPNFGFCNRGIYRSCDATGHAMGAPGRVCDLEQLECTPFGCGKLTSSSAPGGSNTTVVANTCGNLYAVEDEVWLLSLSQTLEPGGAEVRWFVWGADEQDGPYESELTGLVSSTVSYSPNLYLALEAGRYYFIGAQVTGSGASYGFSDPLATPSELVFGKRVDSFCLLNGLNTSLSDRASHGIAAQQLLTVKLAP